MPVDVLVVCGMGDQPKKNTQMCTPKPYTKELIQSILQNLSQIKVNYFFVDILETKACKNVVSFDFLNRLASETPIFQNQQRFDIIVWEFCPIARIEDKAKYYDAWSMIQNTYYLMKTYGLWILPFDAYEHNFKPNFEKLWKPLFDETLKPNIHTNVEWKVLAKRIEPITGGTIPIQVLVVCGTGELSITNTDEFNICTPLDKTRRLINKINVTNQPVNYYFIDIENNHKCINTITFDFLKEFVPNTIDLMERFDIIVIEHCPIGLIEEHGKIYNAFVLFYNIHFCLKPNGILLMPMQTFQKNIEPNFKEYLQLFTKHPETIEMSKLYKWQMLIHGAGNIKRKRKTKNKKR